MPMTKIFRITISISRSAVDTDDAPAARDLIDPGQRQRIDREPKRGFRRKIQRDRQRRAHGAGMHHHYHIARRQIRKTGADARYLLDEAFATRRPAACRRGPEIAIGGAELAREIVVPPAGPLAEILLAELGLGGRTQSECGGRLERPDAWAGQTPGGGRQFHPQRGECRLIAEIDRGVVAVDDAPRSRDRRMADQPEANFLAHGIALTSEAPRALTTPGLRPPVPRRRTRPR